MASLNVAEWTPDQVADWLSGLGPTVARYIPELRRRQLDGAKLLTLRCDDLEYLGMHIIGHQELLLEAVEHLRNFQYEARRECVQQLAMRLSAVATSLARALRLQPDARLDPQALADVASTVRAVKPLVWWLERWSGSGLAERAAALLKLALEACTSAQRDRFAEQPARAVAAAAARAALQADYIIQDVCDPLILQPASLETVSLRQGERPLGFDVVPSCCGHLQLADIRFGSPAHASGALHDGDEIVQVSGRCVVGWGGGAVLRLLAASAAAQPALALRVRRRARLTPAALATPRLHRLHKITAQRYTPSPLREEPAPRAGSPTSSGSELSPPASPTHHLSSTRLYPPPPRAAPQRRHSISGSSPVDTRPSLTIEQFWQQLRSQRWDRGPEPDHAFYRRDKALSCSTGLELSPRPRTCLGVLPARPPRAPSPAAPPPPTTPPRGKLDKSHSTPAYDFGGSNEPSDLITQVIPEASSTPTDSPTILVHSAEKADQILDFKKSSSAIGEAILQQQKSRTADDADGTEFPFGASASARQRALETLNLGVLERRRSLHELDARGRPASRAPPPPPRPPPPAAPPSPPPAAPLYPPLRAVPRPQHVTPPTDYSPLKKHIDANQISLPLRHITKHEIKLIPSERRELPPINLESPPSPASPATSPAAPPPRRDGDVILSPAHTPSSASKSIFPTSKSRSLKKKSSILAKRRMVPARALAAGAGAGGGVWQRVRARAAVRWARRQLLLAHNLLYAYRSVECNRADCMIYLEGFTVSAAVEVKSRAHAFKVYHTGTAFYFACDSHDAMTTWIQLIHKATLLPPLTAAKQTDISKQFSETDYSDTESDTESSERRSERDRDREKEKDKSKFGSLKKLAHRTPRSESQESVHAATSLDRKYLRFFSRHKNKDETKPSKPQPQPQPQPPQPPQPPPHRSGRRPSPLHYMHASNPNLLELEPSALVSPPAAAPDSLVGFVTLEEFMLKKQEEERRQVYTNRVLMGVERDRGQEREREREREGREEKKAAKELQKRLDRIVPDVIYGELPRSEQHNALAQRPLPDIQLSARRRGDAQPLSVRGADGYEKIVYPEEVRPGGDAGAAERWLRRNDRVHSAAGDRSPAVARLRLMFSGKLGPPAAPSVPPPPPPRSATPRTVYPHLQCPPTFQPETYSLARLTPRDRDRDRDRDS
ncbi:uncharacterized protein cnk isoform X3 [Plodia interpunctella]|uniref:uncharacterized protein cnk isoform X3 n=1 Tax=Plodia interpunctella TaxID=58824 RepID=UPI002368AA55|nr:uncharacterized protein LOC128670638 isoform X3 [Plodia interpunctella]